MESATTPNPVRMTLSTWSPSKRASRLASSSRDTGEKRGSWDREILERSGRIRVAAPVLDLGQQYCVVIPFEWNVQLRAIRRCKLNEACILDYSDNASLRLRSG